MSRNAVPPSTAPEPIYLHPWVLLAAALGTVFVGLLLTTLDSATTLRVFLLVGGLIVAGAAISRRLRNPGLELEQRIESAGMLALAAIVLLMAYLATDKEWTSAHIFLAAALAVALVGAVLILLPSPLRRVVASILILFHFTGIFVASTNIATRRGSPPWLTDQAWQHVYRYYLGFLYMTNAYHFYSPDPGPSTLVWFYVRYEDGTARWVRVPDQGSSPVPLHYTRMMVVADTTNLPTAPPSPALYAMRYRDRKAAGWKFLPESFKEGDDYTGGPIPIILADLENWNNMQQLPPDAYREPNDYSKLLISSYVRFVGRNYPHPQDPSIPIKHIKVYRITHQLIGANQMAAGHTPMEEVFLYPYFMGRFNTNGELMVPQQQYDENGNPKLQVYDGFLYWALPVLAVPKGPPKGDFRVPWEAKEYTVHNYMKLHAGEIDSFDDQRKAEPRKDQPKKVEPKKDEPKKEESQP